MSIESELYSFLSENAPDSNNKERNIKLILYHYGFGEAIAPTLEEAAKNII